SAKPPPPVQIRAAPPILSHTKITTCRIGWLWALRQFGNSWEQFALERFDRLAVRGIDDVRVDVERRRDAPVPELLLGNLDRHAKVVEQRRVNVAELMPRYSTEPGGFARRLQDVVQQLRLASRLPVRGELLNHEKFGAMRSW